MRKLWVAVVGVMALTMPAAGDAVGNAAYRSEIESWRKDREERLQKDGGWLTVTGLHWLKPGVNRMGSGAGNDVTLPSGSAPAVAGSLDLAGDRIHLRLEPGVAATIADKPVSEADLKTDAGGSEADVVKLGSRLWLSVIKRGDRYGVRMKDMDSELRRAFKGLAWYEVDESARVVARFEPANPPRILSIPNVLGQIDSMPSPGTAVFTLHGHELRLDPVLEEPGATEFFFILRDQTSGKGTYGAGRFLYSELPKDGKLVLDFNKAYNPPCAFTPFATCPLPPKQNRLNVAIEAGEKYTGKH